ncbi:MAG: AEC family transporter [Lachnospiraceae bacterium]|nr:AEC family transporter [Lachnospiraceae bacterium]
MTSYFSIIINQVLIFATMLGVGLIAYRIKLIDDKTVDGVGKVVTRILLPFLVLSAVASGGGIDVILSQLPFFICILLAQTEQIALGRLTGKLLKLKGDTLNVHTVTMGFSNNGFIGYPLLLALFPEGGSLALAVYSLADGLSAWTVVPYILDTDENKKIEFKRLLTPVTMGTLIGLILLILRVDTGNIIMQTIKSAGATSKYFALLYIGADIGRKSLKTIAKRPVILSTIPIKLVFMPLVVYLSFKWLPFLTDIQVKMLTVISMTPSLVAVSVLANEYRSDTEYASLTVLLTSIACLVTMPFIIWIISNF